MFKIKKISIKGRVAIGIACLKQMLPKTKHPQMENLLFSFLSDFIYNTNLDVSEWEELSAEIIPDIVLNMEYSESEFTRISQIEYLNLRKFYNDIGENSCIVINKIVDIASIHFYTSIPDFSSETVILTEEILSICKAETGSFPNLDYYLKYKFLKNNGWGEPLKRDD